MDKHYERQFAANQSDESTAETAEEYLNPQHHRKDVTTRIAVSLIAIFGVVSLGMGAWLMQARLAQPFKIDPSEANSVASLVSIDSQLDDQLRSKDTDGDSLNDYEEVYVFNTSPYLADTDSDGINDGLEVSQGKDPNCAEGSDCVGIRVVSPEAKISDLFPQFSPTDETLKDKTLQEFRQILIDQGMDPDIVATFTDDFLLLVIDAIVTTESDQPDFSVDQLSDREMRDFLIQLGLQADEVNRVPPDELRNIIKTLL